MTMRRTAMSNNCLIDPSSGAISLHMQKHYHSNLTFSLSITLLTVFSLDLWTNHDEIYSLWVRVSYVIETQLSTDKSQLNLTSLSHKTCAERRRSWKCCYVDIQHSLIKRLTHSWKHVTIKYFSTVRRSLSITNTPEKTVLLFSNCIISCHSTDSLSLTLKRSSGNHSKRKR